MAVIAERTFMRMSERKIKDTTDAAQSAYISNPAVYGGFFNTTQGITGTQRVGERARVMSLKISIMGSVASGNAQRARYLIIQTDTATDVDGSTIVSYFDSLLPGQFLPVDAPFRYQVLLDETMLFNVKNNSDVNLSQFSFKKSWGDRGLQVAWAGTGSVPKRNNVWLFVLSDWGGISGALDLTVYSRLTFLDA